MEWGCIGFLLGAIVCLVFVGVGVCISDRDNKGQPCDDSDVRIYVLSRHRDRSRNQRIYKQHSKEEMSFVLHDVKRLTRGWEREIMDAAIDFIENGDDDLK